MIRRLALALACLAGFLGLTVAPAAASTQLEFSAVPIRATCRHIIGTFGDIYKITWYATQSTTTAATAELQVFNGNTWEHSYDVWVPLDIDGGYRNNYYGPTVSVSGNNRRVRAIAYLNIQTVVGVLTYPVAIDGC